MSSVKRAQFEEAQARKRSKIPDDEESETGSEEEDDDEEESDESGSEESEDEEMASETDDTDLSANQKMAAEQEILAKSRELGAKMKNDRAKAAREGGLSEATQHLKKVNEAFDQQRKLKLDNKTLEVYDSRNLLESSDLVDIALRNVKLGTTGKVLQPEDFVRRLKGFLLKTALRRDGTDDPEEFISKKHDFKEYNWFSLGTFAYSRGNKAITTEHLLGPLEIEKKVRQFKAREKLQVTSKVTTAETVTSADVDKAANDHTTVAVQKTYTIFNEKYQGTPINIFKFFINPHSFSQSVENMFYTSFLLRDGRLLLQEDDQGYPTIAMLPPLPSDQREAAEEIAKRREMSSNHIIFQLEYDSWKKLIKKFNITESYIPTRDPSA